MTIDDISKMINFYLQSKTPESIYKAWVSLYIIGDRLKSDVLLKKLNATIKHVATEYGNVLHFDRKPLYRGLLLSPNFEFSDYSLWDYDHVSFTEDKNVAESFSDIESTYGIVFPKDYIGHIIEYNMSNAEFVWFHYKWAEQMNDETFENFINFWNQKEVILGKHN